MCVRCDVISPLSSVSPHLSSHTLHNRYHFSCFLTPADRPVFPSLPSRPFPKVILRRATSFLKNKTKPEAFTVKHFAGPVEYIVTNFLEKNKDTLSQTLREVAAMSTLSLVSDLFPIEAAQGE